MSTLTRDVVTQSAHDQVVNLVSYADIIGWTFKAGRNKMEWVAEVETEDSLTAAGTSGRWQDDMGLSVPLFLFVPKGRRVEAQTIARRFNITLNGVYEYSFVNGAFQLS
jgi:hypothetical protein